MRTSAITLAAVLAVVGCSANDKPAKPTTTAAASPAVAKTTADPVGRLRDTKTVIAGGNTVKATAYAYKTLRSQAPPDRPRYVFAGVDARVCIASLGPGLTSAGVSWDPWSISFSDDTVLEPVSSWSEELFSVPLYPPIERTVRVGGCVRGWVLFEVPKGKKPTKVTYSPAVDADPAEWLIGP